jgi:N-acetylmuramic acid 6-phosphate (MurNAc-6-P) etherase
LRACDGEVKTAIISHYTGSSSADARRMLDAAHGHLRNALQGHVGSNGPAR